MKTITFYKINGEPVKSEELDGKTKKDIHGMKVKCTLSNGFSKVGFANAYYCTESDRFVVGSKSDKLDYIVLETYVNLNEETHRFHGDEEHWFDVLREKVALSEIDHIDAILHSGLRWGCTPTNRFVFSNKDKA
ncbi:MAG: hypothetical protein IKK70_00825 [Clostridia bacterium]|nr:hypothetical protein [Clostridia bacterium]